MRLNGGSDLAAVAREPLYVSESIPALRMIELFRSSGIHIAMVIDEYGSLEGLVTPTDILTGIAGELPEAGEDEDPSAVQRDDGSWLLDGSMSVEAAARVLGVTAFDGGDYATLAGLVIEELGHLPTPGEHVTIDGWCFEVVDLDGRRIDKLLARRPG
jgi:putative hemolysin